MAFPLNTAISVYLASYFLGAIPFSFIITRLKGIRLEEIGSGNLGATNVFRVLGFKWALFVFICDFLKAFIPVFLVCQFSVNPIHHIAVGGLIVFAHSFSLFVRFKGGKGVASFLGFFFCIDVFFGFSLSFMIFLFALISNYISLAGIFLYIIGPFIVWFKIRNFYILIYSIDLF